MKKGLIVSMAVFIFLFESTSLAAVCPDPNTSSLKWGSVPPPWSVDPFSENVPQAEEGTQFVRAFILVAGLGRGIVCTYRNSLGPYSISWLVGVKIPPFTEVHWRNHLAGYECTTSIEVCVFYPAIQPTSSR